MNAELRATGWANVAAGAVGGPPGYMYLADTLITQRLVGRRRGPAVVAAFGILGVLVVGGAVLEFVPEFVIGGLLLFVGADFMVEWLWSSRRRMTRLDYALMWGIVAGRSPLSGSFPVSPPVWWRRSPFSSSDTAESMSSSTP